MGFDAILKRYFPAIVCVLIAFAAYFQASGMGQLVASSVEEGPAPAERPVAKAPTHASPNQDHSTSAAPILSRNPFDSVTGPLDGKPLDMATAPQPTVQNQEDPYSDPPCDGCKVVLISQSEDPEWSFAAFEEGGKKTLRRVGDEVNGKTIYYVGWDRVWMTSGAGGARCQATIRDSKAVASAKPAAAAAPAAETKPSSKRGRKVPPEIAAKIHKVSETEFNVERSVVDQILENQAELMRSARIVPEKEGDKTVGIRLFGIRPDSLLGTLGLENGDRLQSINGFEMADPQKALEAYARLRSADRLSVSVQRKGKPMTIDFNIK